MQKRPKKKERKVGNLCAGLEFYVGKKIAAMEPVAGLCISCHILVSALSLLLTTVEKAASMESKKLDRVGTESDEQFMNIPYAAIREFLQYELHHNAPFVVGNRLME